MKSALYSSLITFIQTHHLEQKKVLLALSGGVDSMALCHGLIQLHKKNLIYLEVAHVDHGWRKESSSQAQNLKSWVQSQGLTFHLHQLKDHPDSDLENQARKERIAFFSFLVKKEGFAGVMLAHHGDDQAETVLKRVLEGSGIDKMVGLKEKRLFNDTLFFRPLLYVCKKVLQNEVERFNLPVQIDSSNSDTRFLRNRMRHQLIPTLQNQFGKGVSGNLLYLSQMAKEMTSFLDQQLSDLRVEEVQGPMGIFITFKSSTHPLVIRHYLKGFAIKYNQILTHAQLDTILYQLNKRPDTIVMTQDWVISRFEQSLFFIKKSLYQTPEKALTIYSKKVSSKQQDWRTLFKGVCHAPNSYEEAVVLSQMKGEREIRSLLSKSHVPFVLRGLIPLFKGQAEKVFHPLLGFLKQDSLAADKSCPPL